MGWQRKQRFLFLLLAVLLLMIFYLGLPDLCGCTLRSEGKRRLDRVDAALMAGISLAYALVAFWNLGNTQSPESFVNMGNRSVTVELGQGSAQALMLFPGVCLEHCTPGAPRRAPRNQIACLQRRRYDRRLRL